MRPVLVFSLSVVALLALGGGWLHAREPWPKATPPPPPSPIFTPAKEPAATVEEIERDAREHAARVALEIERALASRDAQAREAVFTFLLPELLQVDVARVVQLVARQEPGEARDTLRNEVARQWIGRDRDAAVEWIKSLQSPGERRASANEAMQSLAAFAPDQAIYVSDQFGIGRDDGARNRLVRIWAERDLHGAARWIESQPAGPHTEQLRATVEEVRATRDARRESR
jgi:hypothetical protein